MNPVLLPSSSLLNPLDFPVVIGRVRGTRWTFVGPVHGTSAGIAAFIFCLRRRRIQKRKHMRTINPNIPPRMPPIRRARVECVFAWSFSSFDSTGEVLIVTREGEIISTDKPHVGLTSG